MLAASSDRIISVAFLCRYLEYVRFKLRNRQYFGAQFSSWSGIVVGYIAGFVNV